MALAGLTATASNPIVVAVDSGTFDLGTLSLTVPPNVTVQGQRFRTTITAQGSASQNTGTVVLLGNAEVRNLRVRNTGGAAFATGIYTASSSSAITEVSVAAFDGSTSSTGVFDAGGCTMDRSVIDAIAGTGPSATGVNSSGASRIVESVISAQGVTTSVSATGVVVANSTGFSVTGGRINAFGSPFNIGLDISTATKPMIQGVQINASGPTGSLTIGQRDASSSPFDIQVNITAQGGDTAIVLKETDSFSGVTSVVGLASGATSFVAGYEANNSTSVVSNSSFTETGNAPTATIVDVSLSNNSNFTANETEWNNGGPGGSLIAVLSDRSTWAFRGAVLTAGGGTVSSTTAFKSTESSPQVSVNQVSNSTVTGFGAAIDDGGCTDCRLFIANTVLDGAKLGGICTCNFSANSIGIPRDPTCN